MHDWFRFQDMALTGEVGNVVIAQVWPKAPTKRTHFWIDYLRFDYVPGPGEDPKKLMFELRPAAVHMQRFLQPAFIPDAALEYEEINGIRLPIKRLWQIEEAVFLTHAPRPKPTLEELEAILNAKEEVPIEILPNGEVRERVRLPNDGCMAVTHVRLGPAANEMTQSCLVAPGLGRAAPTWRDMSLGQSCGVPGLNGARPMIDSSPP